MSRDFGNEQDMYVQDKQVSALGPTEEAQDMSTLNRIVVPMPAFTDPHNPMTLSGSVNLPLDRHPVTHSEDYAAGVEPGVHTYETGDGGSDPMAVGSATLRESEADKLAELPEDRAEWQKAHWQTMARHYGLPTSGNLEALTARVTDHEEEQEAIEARDKELHAMTREELDTLATSYKLDPSQHANKDELADAILTAERNQG